MITMEALAERFLDLTQDLINTTNNGDADRFAALMRERDKVLQQLSGMDEPTGDQQRTADLLSQARELNTQLASQFTRDQNILLKEKQALSKGAAMRTAYEQHK